MSRTGKIFSESANIYQDEAKILFNYYQQAAERIVAEEERIEKKIREYEQDRADCEALFVGLWNKIINFFGRGKRLKTQIDMINRKIADCNKEHRSIFRDYKVTKMGVAYVPVADQIKYEDKSFLVDYAGNVPQTEVKLQMSRQNQLLAQTIGELSQMADHIPVVETTEEPETVDTDQYSLSIQELTQSDYCGKIDRSMRTISYCMNDLETCSVQLPLVPDKHDYLEYLEEFASDEVPAGAPVINVFDKERYEAPMNRFKELNRLKDSLSTETTQFETVLQNLIRNMATTVQTISAMKLATTNKLINSSNDLLFRLLKSPYNHYSPLLEADEIQRIREEKFDYSDSVQGYDPFTLRESSRVRYNLLTNAWTAEDGTTTSAPFAIHQIYEEIVAPVVQNLMAENRIERLKIYNQIHDQKVSYVNKWHQDVDAFYRSNHAESSNIIRDMGKTLQEYIEAYNTLVQLQKTEETMKHETADPKVTSPDMKATLVEKATNTDEVIMAFEMQAEEFKQVQDEFNDYMERLQDDIALKAERFGHVEFYDARLRDGYSNEAAIASNEIHELDDRRKPLAAANPLLAKASTLPPTPSIEDLTYEHLSLNLPAMASNALEELDKMLIVPNTIEEPEEEEAEDQVEESPANTGNEEEPAPAADPEESEPVAEDEPAEAAEDEAAEDVDSNDELPEDDEDDEDLDEEDNEEDNEEDGEDDLDEDERDDDPEATRLR